MGTVAGLSQRAVAAMGGVSQVAVHKAVSRGHLDLAADGGIDPDGARSRAWLAGHSARDSTHPAKAAAAASATSTALTERAASLRSREYELAIARANTVERAPFAMELYREADAWVAICRRLPAEAGGEIAALMGVPADRLMPHLQAAMDEFLRLRGDQHTVVDRALQRIAERWPQPPLHRMREPPPLPGFTEPATLAEANKRYADTRRALAEIRIGLRAGELLQKEAAEYAAADLRARWIQGAQDEFAASHGATLLAAAGLPDGHGGMAGALWIVTWDWFAWRLPWRDVRCPGEAALAQARDTLATAAARKAAA